MDALPHPELIASDELVHVGRHRELDPERPATLERGVCAREVDDELVAKNDPEDHLAIVLESSELEGLLGSERRLGEQDKSD